MKRLLLIIFIFNMSVAITQSKEIVLEGIFQGENLFVMNPFASTGVGFCVYEVTVNGQITTDEINSSAFEIDFTTYNFKKGDKIVVVVKHKDGCTPKILNAEVLKPRSTFKIESITASRDGYIMWTTVSENGQLPFIVEQYKWNKWTRVATVEGYGTPGKNTYRANIRLHSGTNKFRVKQVDYSKHPRYSPEATIRNLAASVTFTPTKVKDVIRFSDQTAFEIYDFYGKLVKKGYADFVDVSKLKNGDYFLNFDNTAGATFSKK